MKDDVMIRLKSYFEGQESVSFAYLFGSTVSGLTHSESDFDIGIYFTPKTEELEYESQSEYEEEDKTWLELEKITGKKTDMVVLNRAPSTLLYSVLHNGQKIFVRDEKFLSRLFLAVSSAAEDFRDFIKDFVKIRERSNSLNEIDKERLIRAVSFLEQEVSEFDTFKKVDQLQYQRDVSVKRNIERWAENIVNASIDIAKIILASEKKQIPETYRLILEQLGTVHEFDQKIATELASFSKMRNILAHQYLDLRFVQLKKFTDNSESVYKYLTTFTKEFVSEEEEKLD